MLRKASLIFTSLDKTLVCDHSNESCLAVVSCSYAATAHYMDLTLGLCVQVWCVTIPMEAIEKYFYVILFIMFVN